MDLEDESDSDDNESYGQLEEDDGFPGSSPLSDVFTTLAGLSTLNTTPEAHPEMIFDSSFDLGFEAIPNCLSPTLTPEELDHSLSAVLGNMSDPTFLCGSCPPLPPHPQQPVPSATPAFAVSGPAVPGSSRTTTADEWPFPDRKPTWRTTLTLENVHPETLNSVMQIVIQSRTKVTLETHQ